MARSLCRSLMLSPEYGKWREHAAPDCVRDIMAGFFGAIGPIVVRAPDRNAGSGTGTRNDGSRAPAPGVRNGTNQGIAIRDGARDRLGKPLTAGTLASYVIASLSESQQYLAPYIYPSDNDHIVFSAPPTAAPQWYLNLVAASSATSPDGRPGWAITSGVKDYKPLAWF